MPVDDPSLNLAKNAVARACLVARSVQADLESIRQITKDDRSPVTVADFAVQAIVALALREAAGETLIVGEEHAGALRQPEQRPIRRAVIEAVRRARPEAGEDDVLDAIDACDHDGSADVYWTLDPIDGTKGFIRGRQYAIALALIEGGAVRLGVMGCPNLPQDPQRSLDEPDGVGTLHAAAAGAGAREWSLADRRGPGTPVRRAPRRDGEAVRVCQSVEKAHSSQSDTQRVLDLLGWPSEPVRLDSQCKYAIVARGQADAYLRLPTKKMYVEKIWDHAAGMLIATEAGARVSDVRGEPLDFTLGTRLEANRGVICAAEEVHGPIVRALAELGIAAAAEPA